MAFERDSLNHLHPDRPLTSLRADSGVDCHCKTVFRRNINVFERYIDISQSRKPCSLLTCCIPRVQDKAERHLMHSVQIKATKEAHRMMAVSEERGETEDKLVEKVGEILKGEGTAIRREEILAIHRLPTRGGGIRPGAWTAI
ncbi:hypothetical protein MAR_005581 [Mya arenaria]|uniref:Uncharacterized protein n=1 Tax=Mya arenaria TaxID=6604 RepID=A0ABY7F859_MYAAR|nr:hypothetical protein MAR_005581 [Mya arenaria]